jgi:hypothetical protein
VRGLIIGYLGNALTPEQRLKAPSPVRRAQLLHRKTLEPALSVTSTCLFRMSSPLSAPISSSMYVSSFAVRSRHADCDLQKQAMASELSSLKATVQTLLNRALLVDSLELEVRTLVVKAGRAEAMESEMQDLKRQLATLTHSPSITLVEPNTSAV